MNNTLLHEVLTEDGILFASETAGANEAGVTLHAPIITKLRGSSEFVLVRGGIQQRTIPWGRIKSYDVTNGEA